MRVEYEAIVAPGFMLQVDDAWLPALWDRIGIAMGLEAFRKRCELRVDALNHALRKAARGPRALSPVLGQLARPACLRLELDNIVDIMLQVKAQAYLIEAANARHEHEYAVWETVKLPDGQDPRFPAWSPIRPTWSSIPSWCRSASSASPTSSAART